jgi:hypothetical protein
VRARVVDGDYRPFIEVKLTMNGVSQDVWMMLDTGADTTTIQPDLATALTGIGFDALGDEGPEIGGIGTTKTKSRVTDATITYAGRAVPMRLWVAPTPYPVLGRRDFMRQFDCRFFWGRNPPEFFIDPNTPKSVKSTANTPPPNPTIRPKKGRR